MHTVVKITVNLTIFKMYKRINQDGIGEIRAFESESEKQTKLTDNVALD